MTSTMAELTENAPTKIVIDRRGDVILQRGDVILQVGTDSNAVHLLVSS
jgi:hypothetical protein